MTCFEAQVHVEQSIVVATKKIKGKFLMSDCGMPISTTMYLRWW